MGDTTDWRGRPAPSRPDVLLVGDGKNVHVRRLAGALAERGLAIELACFEGDPIPGVVLHRLGRRPPAEDRRYPLAVPGLAKLVRRRRPRVVHACFLSSYGLMTALALLLVRPVGPRPRIVQSALGSDLLVKARTSRIRARLAQVTLRTADLVTFNSDSLRVEIERLAPGTGRHRFVWGPERALIDGRRKPGPVALSNRRLEPDMRVELVVTAWRRARATEPELLAGWRLVVTHGGSLADDVRAAAAGDPSIDFVGLLPWPELQGLLLRARLMIATPTSDAASAALLDAMAAGIVPVVNAIPGTLEWVDDQVAEIVPRDPTVDELAVAIVRAARRPDDPDRIRARVAAVVWDDEIDRLVAVYRRLSPVPPS